MFSSESLSPVSFTPNREEIAANERLLLALFGAVRQGTNLAVEGVPLAAGEAYIGPWFTRSLDLTADVEQRLWQIGQGHHYLSMLATLSGLKATAPWGYADVCQLLAAPPGMRVAAALAVLTSSSNR